MKKRALPRLELQGADFAKSGFFAKADWRYELLVDYLKLSPSYQAICKSDGKRYEGAPSDWVTIAKTYGDFKNVFKVKEKDWWQTIGMALFGLQAQQAECFLVGHSDHKGLLDATAIATANATWQQMAKPETLLLAIPRNQTKQQALKQIQQLIRDLDFVSRQALQTKSKYALLRTKLQKDTLSLGVEALKMYRRNTPLWQIGLKLQLSTLHCNDIEENRNTAESKRYLQVLASKLVRKAENIAENAARGQFPSDHPLPQARIARPAGRPRITTKAQLPDA